MIFPYLRCRSLREPVEIWLTADLDWPRHDAGAVVRVHFFDAPFELFEKGARLLAMSTTSVASSIVPFPTIDRVRRGNDVDAGGEPFLDRIARQFLLPKLLISLSRLPQQLIGRPRGVIYRAIDRRRSGELNFRSAGS